jgi:hypothetical protein
MNCGTVNFDPWFFGNKGVFDIAGFMKMRNFIRATLIVIAGILIGTTCLAAQEPQNEFRQMKLIERPLNCELNLLYQNLVMEEAIRETKNGGVLVVIGRSGSGESSRTIMRRRLLNVRQYFDERAQRLDPQKVVIAQGDAVKGFGRLEFYINGILFQRLMFPKNDYICISCCGPEGVSKRNKTNVGKSIQKHH